MAYIPAADRVLETSTTTGTGALTLAGAVTGYQAFSAIAANGDVMPYSLWGVNSSDVPTGEWETGVATWGTGGTLTRTLVTGSSNSGAAVNLSAGTKLVTFGVNSLMWNRADTDGIGRCVRACDFMSLVNSGLMESGLIVSSVNGGYLSGTPPGPDDNHPGVALVTSGMLASSGMSLYWGNANWNGVRTIKVGPGLGGYRMEHVFKTEAVNTNKGWRMGLGQESDAATDNTEGAYFELPTSSWALVSKTAASSVRTSTAVATLSASTWYHTRITANAAHTAILFELFSEAGALIASNNHTTNLPVGGLYPAAVRAYTSSTSQIPIVTMDYASFDPGFGRQLQRGRLYG